MFTLRSGAIIAVSIFLIAGAHASMTDQVQVGDRWSYTTKDDATGDVKGDTTVVAIEVTGKEISTRVAYRGKDKPRLVVFDRDWGRLDDSVWKFSPSESPIRGPLKVGAEWRSTANGTNILNGTTLSGSCYAKVIAKEKVTTSAGTFDAFRIEESVRETNTIDQNKESTSKRVTWYAPEVNRWIKRTTKIEYEGRVRDSYTEELTNYSRKP